MATCAHSAVGAHASSGNIPSLSATRRGFLGVVATLPAIAAVGAGAQPVEGLDRRQWDRARGEYERAYADMTTFEASTYRPATDRLAKLVGPCPPLTIKVKRAGQPVHFSVMKSHLLSSDPAFDPVRESRRAYDAYRDRATRLEVSTGWLPISEEMDRLDDVERQARDRLIATPAPDAAALAFKLRVALMYDGLTAEHQPLLASDAERLAV